MRMSRHDKRMDMVTTLMQMNKQLKFYSHSS
jgi:hypothetical protein